MGGGIRSLQHAKMLFEAGTHYCILGTSALKNPLLIEQVAQQFPQQVILGLDAKNGFMVTEGWANQSKLTVIELAKRFQHLPIAAVIYTDIARDGMLAGVNVAATCDLADATTLPIIGFGRS